jgi:phenylalanyl-tRNA synthetase beta subunit
MNLSYNWIQEYFEEKLPAAQVLADEILGLHSFEVEGVEEVAGDTIFDLDVLPNRAHDCLAYDGLAKEVSALTGLSIKQEYISREDVSLKTSEKFSVEVLDEKACPRYSGMVVENVRVEESPEWLVEKLAVLEQRSVNVIVDLTNYVMFSINQPLHAFDFDLLGESRISVRRAEAGEVYTTLDSSEVSLVPEDLVISDGAGKVLALAGVKGGVQAEITDTTTTIVVEAANFDPIEVRKSSQRSKINTDASKRFENGITPEFTTKALELFRKLLLEIQPEAVVEGVVDVYPRKRNKRVVGVSTSEVNRVLGTSLQDGEILSILQSLHLDVESVSPRERIVSLGKEMVGTPYVRGSSISFDAPRSFDCSALASYLYMHAGISIPRVSVDQYVFLKKTETPKEGDLVFINTNVGVIHYKTVEYQKGREVPEGIDHVGIYIGNEEVLHTSSSNGEAKIEKLQDMKGIIGFGTLPSLDGERFVVTAPHERLDISIKEDLIEEIARVYGYDKITDSELPAREAPVQVNKEFYYSYRIREILSEVGFSEVYTYVFRNEGERKVLNPIAQDKAYLRAKLTPALLESLELNFHNLDLLKETQIGIYEIGTVFGEDSEEVRLGVALKKSKEAKRQYPKNVSEVAELLSSELGVDVEKFVISGDSPDSVELQLSALVESLPDVDSYDDISLEISKDVVFKNISPYPSIKRDIAIFVPSTVSEEDVLSVCTAHAGDLLVSHRLFDVYEKDGKTSFAYRLVFQSNEKTLTDEEIHPIMESITKEIEKNDWEVR